MATRLTEGEIRAVAQTIVDKSKRSARVDTGALRRSISYTYVNNVLIFRELYYGQYGRNSELEKNCINLVPNGIEWKIIYTKFGGDTLEVGRTRTGRATQRNVISNIWKTGTSKIKALIAKKKAKRNGEAKEEN